MDLNNANNSLENIEPTDLLSLLSVSSEGENIPRRVDSRPMTGVELRTHNLFQQILHESPPSHQNSPVYNFGSSIMDMQMRMNNLSQLSEMSTSIFTQANSAVGTIPLSESFHHAHITRDQIRAAAPEIAVRTLDQEQVSILLDSQLIAWNKKISGKEEKPQGAEFIKEMPLEEQKVISEWLTRLETSKDFKIAECQQPLAEAVCGMLRSLKNESFRELFFAQAFVNLERCGDRAAMSFNELFLAWQLESLKEDKTSSEKNKLSLIVGAAKTNALRAALQKKIDQKEREQRLIAEERCRATGQELKEEMYRLNEAVEIFIYFETRLREPLNLLTFMKNRLYDFGGFQGWISEADLIAEVEQEHLSFAPLIEMRDSEPATRPGKLAIRRKFDAEIERIEDVLSKGELNDQEYLEKIGRLQLQRKKEEHDFTRDWLRRNGIV